MRKVLLVASVQSHICQFHKPLVNMLHEYGFEVHAAAHNNLDVKPGLKLDFVDKVIEIPFVRSVKDLRNIEAYKEIKRVIEADHYDVIHCNTPIAGVLTRLASKQARKNGTKLIYTAHGFQFFNGSPAKDWLLYYPVEKLMSNYTDLIFTINKEDYMRAKKFANCEVCYIPGVGVNTEAFRIAKKIELRREFNLPDSAYVLLTVGELFPRKNHKVIIEAMAELKQYPIYLVIFGNGILHDKLQARCEELGVEDKVLFAGYRRDVPNVMKSCNAFVFPSKREGLGLAGIEAMASGLPVISSNINGILDYMIDGKTGYMCNPDDSSAFASKILDLYKNPEKSKAISEFNVNHAKEFDACKSVASLKQGYQKVLGFQLEDQE